MTRGVIMDVPLPVEAYDAVHAEVLRHGGTAVDGLLVHIGRPTDSGFTVLEVWRSREDFDRCMATLVGPALARVTGRPFDSDGPQPQEFEVRGLVVPQGDIAQ